MPRAFHLPGVFFLFCAFALLFLVSISLPFLPALDFARVHFEGSPTTNDAALTELRVRSGCTVYIALCAHGCGTVWYMVCVRTTGEAGEKLNTLQVVLLVCNRRPEVL